MKSQRYQHLIPASVILALAVVVAYLSFTQQPAEAFLFPRIISIVFVALSVWNFIRAATGLARTGGGLTKGETLNLLPGLIVMVMLIFWAAPTFGFYVSSTVAFFILYTLYDRAAYTSMPGLGTKKHPQYPFYGDHLTDCLPSFYRSKHRVAYLFDIHTYKLRSLNNEIFFEIAIRQHFRLRARLNNSYRRRFSKQTHRCRRLLWRWRRYGFSGPHRHHGGRQQRLTGPTDLYSQQAGGRRAQGLELVRNRSRNQRLHDVGL